MELHLSKFLGIFVTVLYFDVISPEECYEDLKIFSANGKYALKLYSEIRSTFKNNATLMDYCLKLNEEYENSMK